MKRLWNYISKLGIDKIGPEDQQDTKRLVFYNQVLFIGFFATLYQIGFVWPFIDSDALVFLIVCVALIGGLLLNSKGKFKISKWLYLVVIYSMGILTTIMLGGAALYHVQALLIFASCLIIFDIKEEIFQIVIGVPLVATSILIGEMGWFNAPDFTGHYWTDVARYANISGLLVINTILTVFIIRLNKKNEIALSAALEEVTNKSRELEKNKEELEDIVKERTLELSTQNELLERQNEDKIVLLKEVHHRVRNNLQIITSLIKLQLHKKQNEATEAALIEIQNRVEAMSLVHKKMYETSDFKNIKLQDYTKQIIDNFGQIYGQDYNSEVDIPGDLSFEMEKAIPYGLIVNEMVSNFFKHAHQGDGSDLAFSIQLNPLNQEMLQIKYKDNGSGFPDKVNVNSSDSLGMQLILSLAEQLDGSFEFYNEDGAVYELVIPGKE